MRCDDRFKELKGPHIYGRNVEINLWMHAKPDKLLNTPRVMIISYDFQGTQFILSQTGPISISIDCYKLASVSMEMYKNLTKDKATPPCRITKSPKPPASH